MEEVAGIKEAFDSMDTQKRGRISLEELKAGLTKLGQQVNEADLQILMEAVSKILRLSCYNTDYTSDTTPLKQIMF